jgi:septum formation protein
MKSTLVLASQSPARLQLLNNIGLEPDVIAPADIDETPFKNEDPKEHVVRLAIGKATKIFETHKDAYIIAADSVACRGRTIIGKPKDRADAKSILQSLSGRRHKLYTGLCIIAPDGTTRSKRVLTTVKFKRFNDAELEEYLDTNEWQGKCGAYGIQKDPGAFVHSINGSYSNVVGLPLVETKNLLFGLGFKNK